MNRKNYHKNCQCQTSSTVNIINKLFFPPKKFKKSPLQSLLSQITDLEDRLAVAHQMADNAREDKKRRDSQMFKFSLQQLLASQSSENQALLEMCFAQWRQECQFGKLDWERKQRLAAEEARESEARRARGLEEELCKMKKEFER